MTCPYGALGQVPELGLQAFSENRNSGDVDSYVSGRKEIVFKGKQESPVAFWTKKPKKHLWDPAVEVSERADPPSLPRDLPHWRAVIGAWRLSSLGSEVHVRYIKRIVIHEEYQRSTETSDIALMELDQPVKCSDYIQPACLPDMSVTVSLLNHCYISGWGILGKAGENPSSVPPGLGHLPAP